MKKVKKYADGGIVINQQPPAPLQLAGLAGYGTSTNSLYPTRGNEGSAGTNQTFNIQPQATASQPEQAVTAMKRGGKVKSASSRADGCAVRGKTKA